MQLKNGYFLRKKTAVETYPSGTVVKRGNEYHFTVCLCKDNFHNVIKEFPWYYTISEQGYVRMKEGLNKINYV